MFADLKNGYLMVKDLYHSQGTVQAANGREYPFNNIVVLGSGNYADCHSTITGSTVTYKVFNIPYEMLKKACILHGIKEFKALVGIPFRCAETQGKVTAIDFDLELKGFEFID